MKIIITATLLLCLQILCPAQQLFNDGWQFYKGDMTIQQALLPDTGGWRNVMLPHDWSIEGPFSDAWASATGYLPGGIGWYKKTFTVPGQMKGKRLYIYFDGVYKNSTVWLNGHYLGNRPNGFIAFQYDMTAFIKPNQPNVLVVKADHTAFADSRWYTGSGIYRNVYLIAKEPVHIENWGVQLIPSSVTAAAATATAKVIVKNSSSKTSAITVQVNLKDNKGNTVLQKSKQVRINAADSMATELPFSLSNPQLWSDKDPVLYQLNVALLSGGKILDSYTEQTGFRSLRFDADSGFFLNNRNIKLKGVCIHDDAGALGVAVPEAVWRRRLRILKEGGCNSLRMSHNPHVDYLYHLCDEMGFLVIDEAFDEWEEGKNKWIKGWNVGAPGKDGYHEYFTRWAAADTRDMILRNYNHPSIIAWSIGNEIDYPNDPYSSEVLSSGNNPQIYGRGYLPDHPAAKRLGELSQQLAAVVKKYDTTRPVTAALAGVVMSNTTTYPENLDWVGYNYQEYRYAGDRTTYPKRKIYGSENGMALRAWNAVDSNQFISAQYLWTGIDYLGEAGAWPQRSNGAGLINLAGFPKTEYYFRQSLWSDKPMIYAGVSQIQKEEDKSIWSHKKAEPVWNWVANDTLQVSCFTNCTEAELFINNQSLGKKQMAGFPNHVIVWRTNFQAGKLKVVGYNHGRAVADYSLATAGNAYTLTAAVEKDTAGKTGLVQVVVTVVDKEGVAVNNAVNGITVTMNGKAVLLGLESGSTNSHEDYKANTRKTVNGKIIVYIQKSSFTEKVNLNLSSEGLQPLAVEL